MNDNTLFGTNGIRGIVNQDLTPEFIVKIAVAVGTYFKGGDILVGHDSRTSNKIFFNAVTSGLASTGCNVLDGGYAPTPALQHAIKDPELDGGVIITASHNPPEYNGIKVVGPDGLEIPRSKEEKIEAMFFEGTFHRRDWSQLGRVFKYSRVIEAYIDAIKKHLDTEAIAKNEFRVVVDPVNSVGGLVTPRLLKELGCQVVTINAQLDGRFSREPEPKPETLGELSAVVKALNADLGIAHDGDADRCMFVDERGRVVWGDQSGAILIDYLLERVRRGTVVTPISSSKLLEDIVKDRNSQMVWTRVGSTVITYKMVEIGAELGLEDNGGLFYTPHQPVRDGALAASMMVEVLAKKGKGLSDLIDELPKYHLFKERVDCPNQMKSSVLKKVLRMTEDMNRSTLDGVKALFEDGSVLIRPSGTEAVYRVYAESKEEERAKEMADWGVSLVKKALNSSKEELA